VDPKQYIESGILERYLLGHCTTEEIQEVQCMARVFAEVQAELDAIEQALQTYASMQAVAPPADLKAKILARLDDQPNAETSQELRETKVVPMQSSSTGNKWAIAAAACFLLAMGLGYLYNNSQKQLGLLNSQMAAMQNNLDAANALTLSTRQQLQKTGNMLTMINDTAIQRVSMKGLPIAQNALATIYWNKQNKQVYLNINNMPQPATGKQYQLWAIADGKPVDLGVFDITNDSLLMLKMHDIQNPQAFAVTLEPTGGSVSPTLDQMYVMGAL